MDRCDKIVSGEPDRIKERETTKEALKVCGYPQWVKTSVQNKMRRVVETQGNKKDKEEDKSRGMTVLLYVNGLMEKVARLL